MDLAVSISDSRETVDSSDVKDSVVSPDSFDFGNLEVLDQQRKQMKYFLKQNKDSQLAQDYKAQLSVLFEQKLTAFEEKSKKGEKTLNEKMWGDILDDRKKRIRTARKEANHLRSILICLIKTNGINLFPFLKRIVATQDPQIVTLHQVQNHLDEIWTPAKYRIAKRENKSLSSFIQQLFRKPKLQYICSFFCFILFLILFSLVALLSTTAFSHNSFLISKGVRDVFIGPDLSESEFLNIHTVDDIWNYMENTFLASIPFKDDNNPFLNEFDALYGAIVLRQLRSKQTSCSSPKKFETLVNDKCYSEYHQREEETGVFNTENFSFQYEKTSYQTRLSELNVAYPIEGGYVVPIKTQNRTQATQLVADLRGDNWIDEKTRFVMLEFNLFNGNLNLFTIVRLMFELPPTATIVPQYSINTRNLFYYHKNIILAVLEIILVLFVFYWTFRLLKWFYNALTIDKRDLHIEGETSLIEIGSNNDDDPNKSNAKHKWRIIRTTIPLIWTFLEICGILIFYGGLILRIFILAKLYNLDLDAKNDNIVDLQYIEALRVFESYFFAVLGMLFWASLLRWLVILPRFRILLKITTFMMIDIVTFLILYLIFVAGFSLSFHLILANSSEYFATWTQAFLTSIQMSLGEWSALPEINRAQVIGPFLFYVYILVSVIILLNLVIAMMNKRYEDLTFQSEEQVQIDFASNVIYYSILLGIKFRNKTLPPHLRGS